MKQVSLKLCQICALFAIILFASACDSEDSSVLVGIEIHPICIEMLPGGEQQFSASVYVDGVLQEPDPQNLAVEWEVQGGNVNGTISNSEGSAGLYQAPNSDTLPDEVYVVATSKADPQRQAKATILFSGTCP